MNSTLSSIGIPQLVARYPILGGVLGVAMIVLASFLGYNNWQELQLIPNEPQHILLEEAIQRLSEEPLWVIIDDIEWNCEHIYYEQIDRNTDTYILFTDKNESVWGMAIINRK